MKFNAMWPFETERRHVAAKAQLILEPRAVFGRNHVISFGETFVSSFDLVKTAGRSRVNETVVGCHRIYSASVIMNVMSGTS